MLKPLIMYFKTILRESLFMYRKLIMLKLLVMYFQSGP